MNNKITADDAKEFFQFYRTAKKGYMVSCSNSWHNDSNPSVHIYDSEDTGKHKLMVKCFGGCDPKTILKHINDCAGGRFSPDMIQKISKGFKATRLADQELELTNTYSYKDRNYKVKFQVLRFVDKLSGEKTFRYRRPATKEEQYNTGLKWVYRQEGLDLILYNLPELDVAVNNNLPVFIVEGEGKADIVTNDLGLIGTCNAFGGTNGKFLPQYAEDLRDASVVLIPDNDITGYNHIYECFSVLDPVVKSIKVVVLPVNKEHEDIKEWLNLYGGSKEQLLRLAEMADELKGQTVEFVKDRYKYMHEFADNDVDPNELYPEYNDLEDIPYSAIITDTSPITKVVIKPENFEDSQLSRLMYEKMQAGEVLFEEQGVRAGLCDMCFGYGFKLGMNEDGFPAVVTEKTVDEEGNESVVLPKCNHGIFEENASDFGF